MLMASRHPCPVIPDEAAGPHSVVEMLEQLTAPAGAWNKLTLFRPIKRLGWPVMSSVRDRCHDDQVGDSVVRLVVVDVVDDLGTEERSAKMFFHDHAMGIAPFPVHGHSPMATARERAALPARVGCTARSWPTTKATESSSTGGLRAEWTAALLTSS